MGTLLAAVLPLVLQYGPEVWAVVGPMIEKSIADGTLADDVAKLASALGSLAPIVGSIFGLPDLADVLHSIQPSQDRRASSWTARASPTTDDLGGPTRAGPPLRN